MPSTLEKTDLYKYQLIEVGCLGINFGQQHYQRLKLICNVKEKLGRVDAAPEPGRWCGRGTSRVHGKGPIVGLEEDWRRNPDQTTAVCPLSHQLRGPITTLGERKWDCIQSPSKYNLSGSVSYR